MTELSTQKKFPIMEIFGPTIQGEGALVGQRTHFVRIGGCDYRCRMCDSMHAVDPKRVKENAIYMNAWGVTQVVDRLLPRAPWVTLSGGNPCMWDVFELPLMLRNKGFKVAVETQGSIWRDWIWNCDLVTVSPKSPGMGERNPNYNVLDWFVRCFNSSTYNMNFKIVLFGPADIEFAKYIHKMYPGIPLYLSIGNSHIDKAWCNQYIKKHILLQTERIVELVLKEDELINATILPQLHTLIWGNELGR